MPVTVIVGGQFGSEGKGKVAHALAREKGARLAVRVGGPNSGHTVIDPRGNALVLRQLPTPAILPDTICVLGAGSYIDPEILLHEIEQTGLSSGRLKIDPNAAVITDREKQEEASATLKQLIGSTLSGTGAAVGRRIARVQTLGLAKNESRLQPFLCPVSQFLRTRLDSGERLVLEGTQGFGLSLVHSSYYPFVTSRDTTAASFVAEAGVSPLDVDEIVLVLRAFPIRVAGNSGPLPNETDWQTISTASGSDVSIEEYTSVTRALRRVARFDARIVREAITVNRPTHLVLNHVDYIDSRCKTLGTATEKATSFVQQVESLIESELHYLGFGPSSLETR